MTYRFASLPRTNTVKQQSRARIAIILLASSIGLTGCGSSNNNSNQTPVAPTPTPVGTSIVGSWNIALTGSVTLADSPPGGPITTYVYPMNRTLQPTFVPPGQEGTSCSTSWALLNPLENWPSTAGPVCLTASNVGVGVLGWLPTIGVWPDGDAGVSPTLLIVGVESNPPPEYSSQITFLYLGSAISSESFIGFEGNGQIVNGTMTGTWSCDSPTWQSGLPCTGTGTFTGAQQ